MPSEPKRGISAKGLLLQGVLLALVLAIFFPGVFFRAETLVPGDLLYRLPPWEYYVDQPAQPQRIVKAFDALVLINKFHWMAGEQLREGHWPLWDPYEHCGLPLLANMQSAVFYPPRLIHFFVADGPTATTIYILLKFFLCGMTAYVAAVLLGLPRFAARFVSVAWMVGGYNNIWCYWMEPDVAAWFPLLFLGAEYVLRERFRAGFMLTSAAGSLTLLAGHPETAFSFAFFLGVYILMRLALGRYPLKRWLKVLLVVGLGWSVAVLFTAVQLLPFIEYLANSAQGALRTHHSGSRLPVRNLIGFWLPLLWGRPAGGNVEFAWTNWLFFGLVSWVALGALAVRFPGASEQRNRAIALAASFVVALLVALNAPGFHWINAMPLFRTMWYRYHVVFPLFALCVLAGTGMAQWFSSSPTVEEKAKLRKVVLVGLVVLLALAWVVFAKSSEISNEFVFYGQVAAIMLSVFAALVLFYRADSISRNAVLVILLLECFYAFQGNHPTIPREKVYMETQLTNMLQELPKPARFSFQTGGLLPGLMVYYGLEELQGYDGLYPVRSFERFRFPGELALWAKMEPFCSVRWYLCAKGAPHELWFAHGSPEGTRYIETVDGFDIYENLKAKPRAYLVPAYARVDSHPLAILGGLAAPEYDPERVVLTDAPPHVPSPEPINESVGTATVMKRVCDEVIVETEATHPCVLVLSDNFYPGWRAEIDGVPAEIFPAYTAFRGVVIPAGAHEVRFVFAPVSFRLGLGVSVVSLAAGAIFAAWLGIRGNNHVF